MLQQSQLEYLASTSYLNKIDDKLTVIAEFRVQNKSDQCNGETLVLLKLNVYYEGLKMTVLSFNLMNYSYEDMVFIAKNIKGNAFLLKEVEDYLSGDIE